MTADADAVAGWLDADATTPARRETIRLRSADPDDLTLREARWLGQADRVYHDLDVPAAILDRARADAERVCGAAPAAPQPGLTIVLELELRATPPSPDSPIVSSPAWQQSTIPTPLSPPMAHCTGGRGRQTIPP